MSSSSGLGLLGSAAIRRMHSTGTVGSRVIVPIFVLYIYHGTKFPSKELCAFIRADEVGLQGRGNALFFRVNQALGTHAVALPWLTRAPIPLSAVPN